MYENPRALPRVMVVPDFRIADFGDLIQYGWPEDADPRRVVLLEHAPRRAATNFVGWAKAAEAPRDWHGVRSAVPTGKDSPQQSLTKPDWWARRIAGRALNQIAGAAFAHPTRYPVRSSFALESAAGDVAAPPDAPTDAQPNTAPAEAMPGTARILRYANAEVDIEVEAPAGGFLLLNDVWHPWWRAEVDGTPADILKANVLFRAVALTPGIHRVRFVFEPFHRAFNELLQKTAVR